VFILIWKAVSCALLRISQSVLRVPRAAPMLVKSAMMADCKPAAIGTFRSACLFVLYSPLYNPAMGEMKRREAYESDQIKGSRYISTLVIASAIIAAVRLARDDIGRPSPKIASTISESVSLSRSLLEAVLRKISEGLTYNSPMFIFQSPTVPPPNPYWNAAQWGNLAQWFGAVLTLCAVVVALFKEEFLEWRRHPELTVR
jgi:hypothetical protein